MLKTITKYLSLVKFSHTIFAMPFALIGYTYALTSTGISFDWLLLVKIVLCMVFARNTAMGFNRWADRYIDARNPRTAGREIPAGKVTPRAALTFTIINALLFVGAAAWINNLTLALAPLALFVIMGYSYTKRFTAMSHIVLGVALAIAPVGAYVAVTGTIAFVPIILAGIVISWVSGFDILYSLQDAQHDREHNLHSIPARFSAWGAIVISIILHLVSVYGVLIMGWLYGGGTIYWIGAGLLIALLIAQHLVSTPARIERIGATFGLVNGLSSITYAIFTITDMLL